MFLMIFGNNPAAEPVLIVNMLNGKDHVPRNFRSCKSAFRPSNAVLPSREGLEALNISGSAQFSKDALQEIYRQVGAPPNFFVIDLRQESHGFLNGSAISWYGEKDWANKGKSPAEILQDEKSRLAGLKIGSEVEVLEVEKKSDAGVIVSGRTLKMLVQNTAQEAQITDHYKRFFITDHIRPSDADVIQFIEFVRSLPETRWLHFHCAAGDGRTTTFMAMYDMMRNAKNVSLETIIERQYLIGGIDLFEIPTEQNWRRRLKIERKEFLERFYEYAKNNLDLF